MAYLCLVFLSLVLISGTNGLAIRGRASTTSTCGSVTVTCRGNTNPNHANVAKTGHVRAGETRFQPLGCDCALVKKRCAPVNSLCIGPGGDLTENIGSGTPKRGTCGCNTGYTANCTTNTCVAGSTTTTTTTTGTCSISVPSVTVAACTSVLAGTGSKITVSSCTSPYRFILAPASTNTDTIPYIGADPNTLEIFALDLVPQASTTQTYQIAVVDSAGKIAQTSFSVMIAPQPAGSCLCP